MLAPSAAFAGGLFLPGDGAVSTSRGGAAVASTDDGEALAINPAGLAKTKGTTITLSATVISYAMQFTRSGTYDNIPGYATAYAGTAYPTVENKAKPPLGFGSWQPVPVFTIASDLGGIVPGLHVAIGLFAPNAYPFRDMCTKTASGCQKYNFAQDNANTSVAPSPVRYDIDHQEAAVLLPSIAVAYRIMPTLDVGARFSAAMASLKSTTYLWGNPQNLVEDPRSDAQFNIDAKDNFIPTFGLGATYRPTPNLELGANYNYKVDIKAKGTATSVLGAGVTLGTIGNTPDMATHCETGGTLTVQKACVNLGLPMTAQLGARWKFLDKQGTELGDIEIDGDWEHWGVRADGTDSSAVSPSDYNVIVDSSVYVNGTAALNLKNALIPHGLTDTYGVRVGGSYHIPVGRDLLTVRGGLGYDTNAAPRGWYRADLDGAQRENFAVGAGYKITHWEFNVGFGYIHEGQYSNPGDCDPTGGSPGCDGTGHDTPTGTRVGVDPINPLLVPTAQVQSPVNQGKYTSHYTEFMLGATTWF
ncbi:MAG TPA: outer membrane protein transport protein [Kofleriaceae bacterium]